MSQARLRRPDYGTAAKRVSGLYIRWGTPQEAALSSCPLISGRVCFKDILHATRLGGMRPPSFCCYSCPVCRVLVVGPYIGYADMSQRFDYGFVSVTLSSQGHDMSVTMVVTTKY